MTQTSSPRLCSPRMAKLIQHKKKGGKSVRDFGDRLRGGGGAMTELQEFTDLPNAMSGILVLYMDVSKNRGTLEGCNKEKSQQTTWGLFSLFDLRLDGLDHSFHAFPHT